MQHVFGSVVVTLIMVQYLFVVSFKTGTMSGLSENAAGPASASLRHASSVDESRHTICHQQTWSCEY